MEDGAQASCDVVRRYLTSALFGGDEVALRETVADPQLAERAWLFWAAFTDRQLAAIDVLFADADGTRVAAHLRATAIQTGAWIIANTPDADRPVTLECTGTYTVADGRIAGFRETWR